MPSNKKEEGDTIGDTSPDLLAWDLQLSSPRTPHEIDARGAGGGATASAGAVTTVAVGDGVVFAAVMVR